MAAAHCLIAITLVISTLAFTSAESISVLEATTADQECEVHINTTTPISITEEEYLSFTLDPFLLCEVTPRWGNLNFTNPRIHTLARGLSPALLRYGGTDSCWQKFERNQTTNQDRPMSARTNQDRPLSASTNQKNGISGTVQNHVMGPKKCVWGGRKVIIYPEDLDNLRNLAISAGGKLLYNLNIQLRYGAEWDPANTIEMMEYIKEKGYAGDFDFELGNSPPKYPDITLTGTRIGQDFMILRKLLDSQPEFQKSRMVGPDSGSISGSPSGGWAKTMGEFVSVVKGNLDAVTIHLYYFYGPSATVEEYLDVKHFNSLAAKLDAVHKVVANASGGNNIDLWLGETSDAEDEGTPNISDRYVSGFLWLDKLGVAAKMGYKLVARQILYGGNYPLLSTDLQPNPDYWLSHVYKQLVGVRVLGVDVLTSVGTQARVYAHCTRARAGYPQGSVTLYALNLQKNTSLVLNLEKQYAGQHADVYLLTPDDPEGMTSQHVALNGKRMALVDDHTLPKLMPVSVEIGKGLQLPPLTFGFFVIPKAAAPACTA